jgi:LPS O-antigen subunit length determinant protein (WzzB/FepE family)
MEPLTEKESDVNTSSKKMKIILAILIAVIIALIIVLIIVIVTKKTETITIEKIVEKETETIDWRFYGTIIPNISYANNNIIVNSFKENGPNYNSTIGNINEGNDYEKNERNKYSLYIPY